jgi:molecular chaperone GrpE
MKHKKENIENTNDSNNGLNEEDAGKQPEDNNEAIAAETNEIGLIERIKELEDKNKDLNDRLLRRIAEFENYKRRTEQDQMNLLTYAAEPFIIKILPIYDDLQRSLHHIDDVNTLQPLRDGLKMVHDKFTKVLEDQGVEKIKSKGELFDFNLHEALMRQVSPDVPADTVLEEVEAGYKYKDKVIKHSKVIVSREPDSADTND